MKILIAGAGEVGYHLARLLANELQDITIIDVSKERLSYIENKLDVMTLRGNAASVRLLQEAGVANTDLIIAATASETTNITVAMLSKKLGARKTIARINNTEYTKENCAIDFSSLGIDAMISPAALVADEIESLLSQSSVTDVFDFGEGRLKLVGLHLEEESPIIGRTVVGAASIHPRDLMPVAIQRNNQTIIPRGHSTFELDDYAYFVCCAGDLPDLLHLTGKSKFKIQNVMLVGGSEIGTKSAYRLRDKYHVKLIERERSRCIDLAERTNNILVINGDARNVDLLREENIHNMDAFVAVTGNSETNIMSCLVAKSLGVRKTIALVENMDYIHLSQTIGIDTLLNKKLIAASNIFKFVRQGSVLSIANLHGVDAEVLEFQVKEGSRIGKKPIRKLGFPKTAVIGGVVRGETSFTPLGDFQIKPGDRVVVFTLPKAISKVESFFK